MSAPGGTLVAGVAVLMPAWKRWTLLAVILGSGIVVFDTSASSPTATFTLSALLVLGGALSDYDGRRGRFAIGLVGFAATSPLCGIAPNLEFLILCRPRLARHHHRHLPGRGAGTGPRLWAGASAATTIPGPSVGGLLVNTRSWRMAFPINRPFLLIATWPPSGSHRTLATTRPPDPSTGSGRWSEPSPR